MMEVRGWEEKRLTRNRSEEVDSASSAVPNGDKHPSLYDHSFYCRETDGKQVKQIKTEEVTEEHVKGFLQEVVILQRLRSHPVSRRERETIDVE